MCTLRLAIEQRAQWLHSNIVQSESAASSDIVVATADSLPQIQYAQNPHKLTTCAFQGRQTCLLVLVSPLQAHVLVSKQEKLTYLAHLFCLQLYSRKQRLRVWGPD